MKDEKKLGANKKGRKDKKGLDKVKALEDQLKRVLADYQNLERRVFEDKSKTIRYANEELLRKLLPAFDNLYLVEKYIEDEGVKLTIQKLSESLKEVGVTRIETEGRVFDPKLMECIEVTDGDPSTRFDSARQASSEQEHKVLEEVRPGFLLFDKVIRPAQVKVGKADSSR